MDLWFSSKLSSDLRALDAKMPELSLVQDELIDLNIGMDSWELLWIKYDFKVLWDTFVQFSRSIQGLNKIWSNLMSADYFILSWV